MFKNGNKNVCDSSSCPNSSVLEWCKYVQAASGGIFAALIIAALIPWNSEPFMCFVLVSYDTAAVITEDKTAFLTYGSKKFTAL